MTISRRRLLIGLLIAAALIVPAAWLGWRAISVPTVAADR
jgi:hypothetical protein